MNKQQPFRRVSAFMSALAAIAMMPTFVQADARAKLGTYESRGKGQGGHSGRSVNRNKTTNWLKRAPHGGGPREVARRQRQIAAGIIRVST